MTEVVYDGNMRGQWGLTRPLGKRPGGERCDFRDYVLEPQYDIIAPATFKSLIYLKTVILHGGVFIIGDNAFQDCYSLENFTIPNSVTDIGEGAFWGCTSLASITIPGLVTSIGKDAFFECSSLISVTIPGSVTSIGKRAFAGCTSLKTLIIGGEHVTIGPDAFAECTSLEEIWVHKDDVIQHLTSPFAEYSTLASIPRAMRAAPDATSWTGVQLWMHWSDPEMDAADKRVLCRSRQKMVWTVMHVAERLEIMPSEMWLLIFTFVKHE